MLLDRALMEIYEKLRETYGPQRWWPGDTAFEVMVGAILTQNTNWNNVEKAIGRLKEHDALEPERLAALNDEELQELIRPTGYFRQKSARLKRLVWWLGETCDGELELLDQWPTDELRQELVSLRGIGPETADSILLYALERKVFVVDTYTNRITVRHELLDPGCGYHDLQLLFTDHLPDDLELYEDFHAQLVQVGKRHCRPTPVCDGCPVREVLGEPTLEEEF